MKTKLLYRDRVTCDCGGWKSPKTFKKLQSAPIEVKTREVGNTEVLTIPRQVTQLMDIRKGRRLLIRPKTLRSFEVEVG